MITLTPNNDMYFYKTVSVDTVRIANFIMMQQEYADNYDYYFLPTRKLIDICQYSSRTYAGLMETIDDVRVGQVDYTRLYFPTDDKDYFIEMYVLINCSTKDFIKKEIVWVYEERKNFWGRIVGDNKAIIECQLRFNDLELRTIGNYFYQKLIIPIREEEDKKKERLNNILNELNSDTLRIKTKQ